jgi:hypothetical protein
MVLSAQPCVRMYSRVKFSHICLFSYSSPNIFGVIKSRRMRWAGYVGRMKERTGIYRVLLGKPEGKRPLGKPRYIWEDIKLRL